MTKHRFFRFWLVLLAVFLLASLVGCIPQHKQAQTSPTRPPGRTETLEKVRLPTPAEALKQLGSISGAVYDSKKKRLVLIGSVAADNQTPMRLEDLAVALKSLADDSREPQFSLDAADPTNPRGPNLKAVYYGPIEHTHFGQAMFDADWLLKGYSFGKLSIDGQERTITSSVPGYKNIFDLAFEQPGPEGETWTRFWITADESVFGQHKDAIFLEKLKMKVNTERMWATSKGLESSGGQQDPHGERFAAHFTENYDRFAQEQPALQEVKELSKAVALAKWIKQKHIKVDPRWIAEFSQGNWNTPTTISALEASQERTEQVTGGRRILTMRLYGGVDLAVEPVYAPSAAVGTLETSIKTFLAKPDASPVFSIMYEGKKYPAMVVPITNPGKIMWEKAGVSFRIDGQAYVLLAWLPPEAIGPKDSSFSMPLAA